MVNAIRCIAMHTDTDDVYTLALVYYALSLFGGDMSSHRNIVRDRLRAEAVSQGQAGRIFIRTGYTQDRPARSVSFGYSQDNANQ